MLLLVLALRRRYGPGPALATAFLWVIHVPLIHYEAEFFAESLLVFFVECLIALLLVWERNSPLRALLVGLLLGLAAITHAGTLLLAILILACMAWQARSALRHSFTILAVGGLGLALPIIPVSLQNSRLAEQFMLIQATGGFNYYLGNRPAADGTPNVRVGPEWDRLQLLRFTEGGQRETDLPGGFYYRRAFDFARSEPLHFVTLLLRKAALSVNAHEITASLPHIALYPELARWPLIGVVLAPAPRTGGPGL